MERAKTVHKRQTVKKGVSKPRERKGECAPPNSQDPVCSWPSLLSTHVNATLDKFLFEFPH